MEDVLRIRQRLSNKKQAQKEWKYATIDLAIDTLNGGTHREKEHYCKQLLKQLRDMPEIQDWDLDIEECPF